MRKIILRNNEKIEVHGKDCSSYLVISKRGKSLFIEYLSKQINLQWVYTLISKYQKKINKMI